MYEHYEAVIGVVEFNLFHTNERTSSYRLRIVSRRHGSPSRVLLYSRLHISLRFRKLQRTSSTLEK